MPIENYQNTALSVLQPWASFLTMGIKKVETRSFPVPDGWSGRIFIHAMKTNKKTYDKYLSDPEFRLYCNELYEKTHLCKPTQMNIIGNADYIMPWPSFKSAWHVGKIIGHVELGECFKASELKKKWETAGKFCDWEREWVLGDLSSGRFAWMCRQAENFKRPISNVKPTNLMAVWDCTKYIASPDYI
jgi:hypothetical protein